MTELRSYSNNMLINCISCNSYTFLKQNNQLLPSSSPQTSNVGVPSPKPLFFFIASVSLGTLIGLHAWKPRWQSLLLTVLGLHCTPQVFHAFAKSLDDVDRRFFIIATNILSCLGDETGFRPHFPTRWEDKLSPFFSFFLMLNTLLTDMPNLSAISWQLKVISSR